MVGELLMTEVRKREGQMEVMRMFQAGSSSPLRDST